MSIRRGGNIVAGSVNKKEIVDLIENETRVVVKVIEGVFENDSSFISLSADDLKIKSQIISVNLGNSVILPNTYSLSSDGKTLNFVEQIEQGTKYAISYTKKFDIVGEDYVTEAELNVKQDKLTAGKNITIENNIISSDCINDKITNCITEIPQDIKLELSAKYAWFSNAFYIYLYTDSASVSVNDKVYGYTNLYDVVGTVTQVSGNTITIYFQEEYDAIPAGAEVDATRDSSEDKSGILTLKAGSKVYVPNGAGKFDEVIVNSDINYQGSDTVSVSRVVYYNKTTNGLLIIGSHSSGTTDTPSSTAGNCVHYNTSTNKIQLYINGVAQSGELSLPLCIIKSDGTNIVGAIEQVFNGFGYIGSTVFALPGVKGLIPNGRNADGSLKSIEFVNPVVRTLNVSGTYNVKLCLAINGIGAYTYVYDEIKNAIYNTYSGNYYNADRFIVGDISYTNGVITSLQLKTTFHALDYNDKETIVGWGMPDYNSLVELGTTTPLTWTCPMDGWVQFQGGTSGISVKLNDSSGLTIAGYGANSSISSGYMIPVVKGQTYYFGGAPAWRHYWKCKGV